MCTTAKESLSAWWILCFMTLFLWYRNNTYDRALSCFIFTLGLVQLIEYGIHSGADPSQSARALFLILWLQCLVLAIGVFLFIKSDTNPKKNDVVDVNDGAVLIISGWNLLLYAIIFIVGLGWSFYADENNFDSKTNEDFGCVEWSMNGGSILGNWWILYIFGIFCPLILLFAHYQWSCMPLAILIGYGLLSAGYVANKYPPHALASMWCYLGIGFAFLAWYIGMIYPSELTSDKNIL